MPKGVTTNDTLQILWHAYRLGDPRSRAGHVSGMLERILGSRPRRLLVGLHGKFQRKGRRMIIESVELITYDLSISSHDGWSTVQGAVRVVYFEAEES